MMGERDSSGEGDAQAGNEFDCLKLVFKSLKGLKCTSLIF